jgi:hypothetical protein
MSYGFWADFILSIHALWILFMLAGFVLTLWGFSDKRFFEWNAFRTLHLAGIAYVGCLAGMSQSCPLTTWENTLRIRAGTGIDYEDSFIAYYLEKLVYPEINPLWIQIPTVLMALFIVAVFIIKPPGSFKKPLLSKLEGRNGHDKKK